MATTDPTMDFISRFKDKSKWKIIERAPICIPHERSVPKPDGEVQQIVVDENDLYDIANQINSRAHESGVYPVITLGHRQQSDPHFPEKSQPDIVGYILDAEVGTFGPANKLATLATLYIKDSEWDEAKKYPFRSIDFYPSTKKVTGLAFLKRDPYLPLGMVTYAADSAPAPTPYEDDGHSWVDTISNSLATGIGKTLLIPIAVPLGMLRGALRNLPGGESVGMQNTDPAGETPPPANAGGAGAGGGDMGGGPPPGYAEWLACFEYALKNHPALKALAGGGAAADAVTPPEEGGDTGPKPYSATTDAAWAQAGANNALRNKPVGMPPLQAPVAAQNRDVPIAYQAAHAAQDRRSALIEQKNQQLAAEINQLKAKQAIKDSEFLVYQLVQQGVKPLYQKNGQLDKKAFDSLVGRLARKPEAERKAYVEEITAYWEKDASFAYAAAGAPVGYGMIGVPHNPAQSPGEPAFTEAHLAKANEYLTKHPGADWDQACAYALGQKPVTG